ncbi:MAG: Fe-S-containing protein [Bifidobacteriaceae bacterium]|nr:Fe-S-containing protein [Bifidobacteriaceae bacterium]
MLEQFVTVLPAVLPMALAIMCMSALLQVGEGKTKPITARLRGIGCLIGISAGLIFSTLRALAIFNQRTFFMYPVLLCCVLADIAVIIMLVVVRNVESTWNKKPFLVHIANVAAGIAIAAGSFNAVTVIVLQLTIFVQPGETPFTSDMLLRVLGFLLGIIAAIVIAYLCKMIYAEQIRKSFMIAAIASLVVLCIEHLTSLLQVMQFSIILLNNTLFKLLVWSINNTNTLIQIQTWVFILPVITSCIVGFKKTADVENFAQTRAIRARKHRAVTRCVAAIVAFICLTLALSVGVAATKTEIVLSDPEPYSLKNGVATIKLSQVDDGHLHRFEYKAKDGTMMRFIIIKKQGGAYGVGLDACENCGDAGYYEKDGKIICKKCDVAINLATIGFKGGCNPVPVNYEMSTKAITIAASDLDALSAHFK